MRKIFHLANNALSRLKILVFLQFIIKMKPSAESLLAQLVFNLFFFFSFVRPEKGRVPCQAWVNTDRQRIQILGGPAQKLWISGLRSVFLSTQIRGYPKQTQEYYFGYGSYAGQGSFLLWLEFSLSFRVLCRLGAPGPTQVGVLLSCLTHDSDPMQVRVPVHIIEVINILEFLLTLGS